MLPVLIRDRWSPHLTGVNREKSPIAAVAKNDRWHTAILNAKCLEVLCLLKCRSVQYHFTILVS